ncbi:hypothetical protein [Sporisorium scitamineum]|uniref:Uncharacterized protein n=1 Tax=Sporisorium scitamineum TaxID=49012 RepID=A0A0F7RVD1_9BASI|nr:hypothetical protein [Sporisorium scitamineum]
MTASYCEKVSGIVDSQAGWRGAEAYCEMATSGTLPTATRKRGLEK